MAQRYCLHTFYKSLILLFLLVGVTGCQDEPAKSGISCDIVGVRGGKSGQPLDCGRAISIKRSENVLHLNGYCMENCLPRTEIIFIAGANYDFSNFSEANIIYRDVDNIEYGGYDIPNNQYSRCSITLVEYTEEKITGSFDCSVDLYSGNYTQSISIRNGNFLFYFGN